MTMSTTEHILSYVEGMLLTATWGSGSREVRPAGMICRCCCCWGGTGAVGRDTPGGGGRAAAREAAAAEGGPTTAVVTTVGRGGA